MGSAYSKIPDHLKPRDQRDNFIVWLTAQFTTWTAKRSIAAAWAKSHHIPWTLAELQAMGATLDRRSFNG